MASATLLALMLLGPGVATASVAGFRFIDTANLPTVVTPGADAGYKFTIQNNSSSNISQLYLTAKTNGVPTFFWNSRGTTCQQSPYLSCSFGALNSLATIDVIVAYSTAGASSPFSASFSLDTTGGATTDAHHSHGDSVTLTLQTALNANANFAGAFEVTGTDIGTTGTLGKRNPQTSHVAVSSTLTPVTIEDGITSFPGGATSDPCLTLTCIGDWTVVHATNTDGTLVGPIHVSLLIYGQSVKGNPDPSTISLWHEGSDPNPITQRCDSTTLPVNPAGPECITVTMQGQNYLIDGWLAHNGTLRGLS